MFTRSTITGDTICLSVCSYARATLLYLSYHSRKSAVDTLQGLIGRSASGLLMPQATRDLVSYCK